MKKIFWYIACTCWQETLTNFEWNCKLVVTKSNLLLIVHKSALEKKYMNYIQFACKRVWCNLWVIMSADLCAYVCIQWTLEKRTEHRVQIFLSVFNIFWTESNFLIMVKSKILPYKFTYLSMVKNIWTHSKNIEHGQKYLNMVKKYLN